MLAGCTTFTSGHRHQGLGAGANCQLPGQTYSFSNFQLFQQPLCPLPLQEQDSILLVQNASPMDISLAFLQDEEENSEEKHSRSYSSEGIGRKQCCPSAGFLGAEDTGLYEILSNFRGDSSLSVPNSFGLTNNVLGQSMVCGTEEPAVKESTSLFLDTYLEDITELKKEQRDPGEMLQSREDCWMDISPEKRLEELAEALLNQKEGHLWDDRTKAQQQSLGLNNWSARNPGTSWAGRTPQLVPTGEHVTNGLMTKSSKGPWPGRDQEHMHRPIYQQKATVGISGVELLAEATPLPVNVNSPSTPAMNSSSESPSLMDSPDPKLALPEPRSVLDLVVSPDLKPRFNLQGSLIQPKFSDIAGASLMEQRGKGLWLDCSAPSLQISPGAFLSKGMPSPVCQNNAWVDSVFSELAGQQKSDIMSTEDEPCYKLSVSSYHLFEGQQSTKSEDALLSGTESGDETPSEELAGFDPMKSLVCEDASSLDQATVEEGLELINLLIACVEATPTGSITLINHLLARLGRLASPEGSSIHRMAAYFTEGLACRVSKMWPQIYQPLPYGLDLCEDELLSAVQVLNHATPFVKFSHYTANDIILQGFEGENRVHVIDFDIKQGLQWPALFQSLATRSGGPPAHIRITGVGECKEDLQDTGDRLAEFAEALNLPFEFHAVVDKLEDVRLWMLHVKEKEAVAVNCLFQLHKTLYDSGTAINDFLGLIQSTKPKVVAIVEQEASHNQESFEGRFVEALQYYAAVFDLLNVSLPPDSAARLKAEQLFAREIRNILACEGSERTERHEKVEKWQQLMEQGGFCHVPLTERACLQARMLLEMFSCKNYKLKRENDYLTIGWLEQSLFTASAWAPK